MRTIPWLHRSILVLLLLATSSFAADAVDQRVSDLLTRMSVEEKAGQLVHYWRDKKEDPEVLPLAAGFRLPGISKLTPAGYAEAINRLQHQVIDGSPHRIPALIHDECLHGAIGYWGATTCFPQSIGLAASFDPDLVAQVGAAIAEEERSVGTRLVLAPVLNLSRDPRWGRTEETFGESARLAADLGVAYVKPFRERGVATALKHFVANYGDGGSDSAAVFIEASELHQVWFKPFREAIQRGGAAAVMPCYNSVNGLPAHANPWLLTTVLRQGWGFDGIVVSDYNAWLVYGTHRQYHPETNDLHVEEAIACFRAGMDLPLHHSAGLLPRLVAAVQDGRLPMAALDANAGRMLRVKFLLGIFEKPFAEPEQAARVMHSAEHQALAKRSALAGLTLLRNDGDLLPLNPARIRRLGVAGPHADKVKFGGYSRGPIATDTMPLTSLKQRFGAERVIHLSGTPDEMARAAVGCDVVIYCAGVKEGEATDRARFDLPGADTPDGRDPQPEAAGTAIIDKKKHDPLGNQVAEICALGSTGIPVVLCLVAGSPVGLGPVENAIHAVLVTWYGGEAAGTALAEVLAGDAEPGGRLPITWPRHGGQIPLYHDLYPSGRGGIHYDDLESSPRFPFGFGLGYTTWTLSDLNIEANHVAPGQPIRGTVQVANTGSRAGSQVVQVYVAQRVAARVLPLQRLEVYQRVALAPGECRTVTFALGDDHLGWYDAEGRRHLDPGEVELRVGTSAGHLPLKATVQVQDAGTQDKSGK